MDGQLYGWEKSTRRLVRINPNTAAISFIGPVQNQWRNFGALYFDEQGTIIGYGDNLNQGANQTQETLVKIDPATGVVNVIGTGPVTNDNDGTSCSFGLALTKACLLYTSPSPRDRG